MEPIPSHELDLLVLTVEDAVELGAADEAEEGKELLLGGLYRVEHLQQEGHPWATELADHWKRKVAEFEAHYPAR